MCIHSALLFCYFLINNGTKLGCKMNSPNKRQRLHACVSEAALHGVSSHQSSIVYRGLNKLLIRADIQYGCSLLEWADRSEQMCLLFPSWTVLFLPIAAIRTGSMDWEHSRFMCRLHTHGCYCSCICATCAEYFSSLRLFTALWFPPSPLRLYLSSESALHSKQCEIDDCVLSGLVWEEQSVWQFMALSRCTRLSVQHPFVSWPKPLSISALHHIPACTICIEVPAGIWCVYIYIYNSKGIVQRYRIICGHYLTYKMLFYFSYYFILFYCKKHS